MITFAEFIAQKQLTEAGKHGGDRKSKNPFAGMAGDIRAVNPARAVIPFPPGPMPVKGKFVSVGKLKKQQSGVIGGS